jgi:hypothetical protein
VDLPKANPPQKFKEVAMNQQFIITGNVFITNDGSPLFEGRVQAFNRAPPHLFD